MPDSFRRAVRTLIQLIAGGGLYALTTQLTSDIPSSYAVYVVIGYSVIVSWAVNYCEDAGWIPSVLKSHASSGADPVTSDPIK